MLKRDRFVGRHVSRYIVLRRCDALHRNNFLFFLIIILLMTNNYNENHDYPVSNTRQRVSLITDYIQIKQQTSMVRSKDHTTASWPFDVKIKGK